MHLQRSAQEYNFSDSLTTDAEALTVERCQQLFCPLFGQSFGGDDDVCLFLPSVKAHWHPLQSPLWHAIYFDDKETSCLRAATRELSKPVRDRGKRWGGARTDRRYFGRWAVGAGASGMIIRPCFEYVRAGRSARVCWLQKNGRG